MGSMLTDCFRAGAETGDRDFDSDLEIHIISCLTADKGTLIVHHALGPGDRGFLLYKVVEGYFQVREFGFQVFTDFTHDGRENADANFFVVLIDNLNKTAHVSAFEEVGKTDIDIERAGCMLDTVSFIENRDRVLYPFDADLVDIDMSVVLHLLGIMNGVAHTLSLVKVQLDKVGGGRLLGLPGNDFVDLNRKISQFFIELDKDIFGNQLR